MEVFYLVFCLVVSAPAVFGYPTGAPDKACIPLLPGHMKAGTKLSPQTSASPYTLEFVGGATSFPAGTTIKVKISGSQYAGFTLQVREDGSTTPLGTWNDVTDIAKSIKCNTTASTLTHTSENAKPNTQEYTWNPPQDAQGTYKVKGTVAESHDNFWVLEPAAFTLGSQTNPTSSSEDSGESTTAGNQTGSASRIGITIFRILLAVFVFLLLV